jgi:hypothetical protein
MGDNLEDWLARNLSWLGLKRQSALLLLAAVAVVLALIAYSL